MANHNGEKGDHRATGVIEVAGLSHVGKRRTRNEDVIAFDAHKGWAVLADGMGGYAGGDVAAQLGVDTVRHVLDSRFDRVWSEHQAAEVLSGAVRAANKAIHRAALRDPDLAFMGSTIVAVVFVASGVVCAHVGDSRLYRLRAPSGPLTQCTRDHTVLQARIDAGELDPANVLHSEARGPLTRGLGVSTDERPDVGFYPVAPGDILLLCSDGLTDMLHDDEIQALILGQSQLADAAQALIEAANIRGGRDNVSVVLARMVV